MLFSTLKGKGTTHPPLIISFAMTRRRPPPPQKNFEHLMLLSRFVFFRPDCPYAHTKTKPTQREARSLKGKTIWESQMARYLVHHERSIALLIPHFFPLRPSNPLLSRLSTGAVLSLSFPGPKIFSKSAEALHFATRACLSLSVLA